MLHVQLYTPCCAAALDLNVLHHTSEAGGCIAGGACLGGGCVYALCHLQIAWRCYIRP